MSPFLGPLRTLNLHSAEPSRAPSPFQLPPASVTDAPASPVEDHPHGQGRKSYYGSPPRKSEFRSRSAGDLTHVFPRPMARFPYANERGSTTLPTPQLSSGTSSIDSSPGSYARSLVGAAHLPSSFPSDIGTVEVPSAASSRAPSPGPSSNLKSYNVNLQLPPPQKDRDAGHAHHHLAHSLRVAFGMTPIHTQGRSGLTVPGGPSSFTFGNLARYETLASGIQVMSMPASRSSSPPIMLPPLKLNSSSPCSPSQYKRSVSLQDVDMEDASVRNKKEPECPRVELPGFHEFEAATGTRDLKIN